MVFILSTILGMSAICMFCAILGQSSVEQMKLFVYKEQPVQCMSVNPSIYSPITGTCTSQCTTYNACVIVNSDYLPPGTLNIKQ